jgi:DNA-binding NtrC family response regulator
VQVKLLRVLQEGEIERVGSHQPRKVDVRIISATNQDLARLLARNQFREDLYYRINVIPINLPPLRRRLEDLPLLADHFARAIALRSRRPHHGLSAAALQRMAAYAWPGNVRELINALEYAFVTCRSGQVQPQHLPPTVQGLAPRPTAISEPAAQDEDDQRREILAALQASGGRKTKAAELLGISRVTLWKRLKRLGLQV